LRKAPFGRAGIILDILYENDGLHE